MNEPRICWKCKRPVDPDDRMVRGICAKCEAGVKVSEAYRPIYRYEDPVKETMEKVGCFVAVLWRLFVAAVIVMGAIWLWRHW